VTEAELVSAIAFSIPSDRADREAAARAFLSMAVRAVGRLDGVDFNRDWVTFNLISGQKEYVLGKDILSKYSEIRNIQKMWRTDTMGWDVSVVGLDLFNSLTRGGTGSGAPTHATLFRRNDQTYLEVYPNPDSAYEIKAPIKKVITSLDRIPDEYHDVVYAVGITLKNAAADPQIALALMQAGLTEIKNESLVGWTGSVVQIARTLDPEGTGRSVSSYSLRRTRL